MGAENSVLEGCQWGEEVMAAGLEWDLRHAELKDSRPITVFQPRKNERKYNDMIQQLAKGLKMLRHPSILRYVGAGKSSEGYFLVTEQATPLAIVLDKLTPLELCSGLSDILDALTFLHDKVGMVHNNVCVSAIFVTKDGSWKLGELQHACPYAAATSQFLDACRAFRNQESLAPEEKQNKVETKVELAYARDMYGAGILCEQMSEQLSELGEFNKSFEQKIAMCLSPDPSVRLRALELRNDCVFKNDFIEILSFVRNVAVKQAEEKAEFFRDLLPRLKELPEELVARRLAIPLLSRFVLLEEAAVSHLVPHLLTPRPDPQEGSPVLGDSVTPLLSHELFENYVTPELQRIFLVHDVHIRLVLLSCFAAYAPLFDRETLCYDIFPQVLLGLRDSHDSVVASSLRALADLVPLLGGDMVIGGHRKTFFFEGMPKFLAWREKETGPSNAGEVLWPHDRKLRMVNGKPLLRDLVAEGLPRPIKGEQHEQRHQERERRREEARKKKEERHRKFRLLQAEMEAESEQLDMTVEEKTEKATEDIADTVASESDSMGKADRDDVQDVHISSRSTQERVVDKATLTDEEKFASEQSEDGWEDWEDRGHHSGQKLQADIISKEIEAELSRMSGGKSLVRGGGKKVQTSPDPYTPSTPTEVDWSDSQLDTVVINPRQSSHTDWVEGERKLQGITKTDVHGLKSEKSSEPSLGKGLKLVSKGKTTSSTSAKATLAKMSGASDDLGLGYDIKSIRLSVTRQEEDFFADMMPDIKHAGNKGLSEMGVDIGGSKTAAVDQTKNGPGSSLFAVVESATEESAAGWKDEGEDWGGAF